MLSIALGMFRLRSLATVAAYSKDFSNCVFCMTRSMLVPMLLYFSCMIRRAANFFTGPLIWLQYGHRLTLRHSSVTFRVIASRCTDERAGLRNSFKNCCRCEGVRSIRAHSCNVRLIPVDAIPCKCIDISLGCSWSIRYETEAESTWQTRSARCSAADSSHRFRKCQFSPKFPWKDQLQQPGGGYQP